MHLYFNSIFRQITLIKYKHTSLKILPMQQTDQQEILVKSEQILLITQIPVLALLLVFEIGGNRHRYFSWLTVVM